VIKRRVKTVAKKFKIPSKHEKPRLHLFSFEDEKPKYDTKSYIELISNREITLEGCQGVAEYKADYIKLRLLKGNLIICGEGFSIASFENKNITIKGKISSIEFCVD